MVFAIVFLLNAVANFLLGIILSALLGRTSGSAERKSLMGLDKGVGFCLRGDLEAE
jgi:hypothetical protein